MSSIKIAMGYDDNIIQFCFSNYFYNNGQICYFSDNKILSLICYDFAQYFFKLRNKKYEQKISEAYYYEGLAYFYKKEKRFEDQEIALASYVKSYKIYYPYIFLLMLR
ncbi:unnamed protein product [marine sediment metagenome]|uniref:Uncharacterized protein n=1 Tax=marine sediment metagenome TaxID=412755 RepID=X1BNS6_9ZZZZ